MSEQKYKSYEVPVFRTERTTTAAYLLAAGITMIGVEGGSTEDRHTFRFATSGGTRSHPVQTAELAANYQSGKAPEISQRALSNADERLRAAVLDFDHQQATR